ncbi:hypothetical protein [Miniphocaeibacter halophilus]|uniref:Uncharacterized protein n=1 Tax=Miniphocaeibacter halophilus TaxID=2931922 RepID=A0AC61MR23_9FIRM|nr:hypothetical protein [Miniphocaeibacter halophilus]QQK07768.1 hypothetical protein JFY71_10860 [Miniphocaeibacter halophilus]
MSAGALNMCKFTIDTPKNIKDEIIYLSGLSLTELTVEVHFNKNNKNQLLILEKTNMPVYCIVDTGAVVEMDKKVYVYGDVYKYDNMLEKLPNKYIIKK